MNRRGFLKLLGMSAVAAAVPEVLYSFPSQPRCINYADYVSFSDLALDASLNPEVEECARLLAYRTAADMMLRNYYEPAMLDSLRANTPFAACYEPSPLPRPHTGLVVYPYTGKGILAQTSVDPRYTLAS